MISLYKDPEGTTMFSKQRPASSNHQPQKFSFSASKQGQINSTVSEVESLRKRVKELESKLTSMEELEKNGTNEIHLKDVHMESV